MQIEELIEVAGPPLSNRTPQLSEECAALAGSLRQQLLDLCWRRNGFYAFFAALHVFPADESGRLVGMSRWNANSLWRADYGGLAEGCLFFAQDLVGGQFCIFNDGIYKFDPETGDKTYVCQSIEEWAGHILADDEALTLWPLAERWQQLNGPLAPDMRLLPKTPFVLGGAFSVDNLYAAEAIKAMRFYADLAKQIHDLPDGAQVQLRTID